MAYIKLNFMALLGLLFSIWMCFCLENLPNSEHIGNFNKRRVDENWKWIFLKKSRKSYEWFTLFSNFTWSQTWKCNTFNIHWSPTLSSLRSENISHSTYTCPLRCPILDLKMYHIQHTYTLILFQILNSVNTINRHWSYHFHDLREAM